MVWKRRSMRGKRFTNRFYPVEYILGRVVSVIVECALCLVAIGGLFVIDKSHMTGDGATKILLSHITDWVTYAVLVIYSTVLLNRLRNTFPNFPVFRAVRWCMVNSRVLRLFPGGNRILKDTKSNTKMNE